MMVHNEEGFIYQHDAPYIGILGIVQILDNKELAKTFQENSKKKAIITIIVKNK